MILCEDLVEMVHLEKVLWHPRRGIYISPYKASGHVLFKGLSILKEELVSQPTVALVLSSNWCILPGYAKRFQQLPGKLRSRLIGGTHHKRIHGVGP